MVVAMATTNANAAFTFTDGDLLLGVQATSGTGANQNLFFNLGPATGFRDNPAQGAIGNISTSLSNAFGANWYSRGDVFFGVFGNLNFQPNTGIGNRPAVDGDPSRTIYASAPASIVMAGQLVAAGTYSSSALGSMGGNFAGLENVVTNLLAQADGAAIMDQDLNPVEWNNSWSKWNPTPGAAFNVFTGGIQQNFGKDGDVTYVDIQRILSTDVGADPAGVIGGGQYIGSIGISSDGTILAIPEPSTALLVLGAAAVAFRRRRTA
jgi:hypothetical protein